MREWLYICRDGFLAICCIVGLFAWAAWRSGQIKTLRLLGNVHEADELEAETDRGFRELAGMESD